MAESQTNKRSEDRTEQKDLSGDVRYKYGGGWEFTAKVRCEDFWRYVSAVEALAGDAKMEITPEKVTTTAVDPANVAIVEDAEAQLTESSGHLTVGVNFYKLKKELPSYYPDDEYHITVESDNEETTIRVWSTEGEVELPAQDPSRLRAADPPDLDEFEQEFQMPSYQIAGALGKTAEASSEAIRVTPAYGELLIEGSDGEIWDRSWPMEADCEPGGVCRFSSDYIADVCSGIPIDETVTVKIGEEYPIVLEAESVSYLVAPRLKSVGP